MNFLDKLLAAQRRQHSLLCVGLDPDPSLLPEHLRGSLDGILEFNRQIIDATKDIVCAYKPNLAFYETLGSRGWEILEQTRQLIPEDIIAIGDAKRGDIGNTAERSASALFDHLQFDAVTINPYMGYDAVEPFVRNPDRGAFILVLTSNPGSKDFQRLKSGSRPVYEKVVRSAVKWNTNRNIGLVVGATHPRELQRIRKLSHDVPILIPGIGKQGGDLRSAIKFGCSKNGELAIINAGRSILYASAGKEFAQAARIEAVKLRDEIRQYQGEFFSGSR
jgi:orotidine-5'-phosphate decarboxylase